MKCEMCGKGPLFGHAVSHSKIHTKRKFHANIHAATIEINGKIKHMNLCTRCIRTHNKVTKTK